MYYDIVCILIILLIIIAVSHVFCNAMEHFGEQVGVTEGVTGSIFSAVATALPETLIPILSLLNNVNADIDTRKNIYNEISLGAILGAPLMLATLSLFIMAISVVKQRGVFGKIKLDFIVISRDLRFFLFSYALAFLAVFTQTSLWRNILNIFIVLMLGFTYLFYIFLTIRNSKSNVASSNPTVASEPLFLGKLYFFNKKFKLKENLTAVVLQLIFTLILLIFSANLFISKLSNIAIHYNVSAFLLSLIVVPIATELPEKINSIIWLAKNKDTLAIGNITGAMVFQGCLLPIIGILFTNWSIDNKLSFIGIGITIIATLWFYYNIRRKQVPLWIFAVNGALYLIYILICNYNWW